MRYQFIKEETPNFSLSALCRTMQVSRTGYYAWKDRKPGKRQIENQTLSEKIKAIFEESKETSGSPRIYEELKESGGACSEKRVARWMQALKISAVERECFVVTTYSAHEMPVAENLLACTFKAETPDTRWTADIIYLWTGQRSDGEFLRRSQKRDDASHLVRDKGTC